MPTSEWNAATNSGIEVIGTRRAITAPMPPPSPMPKTTTPQPTEPPAGSPARLLPIRPPRACPGPTRPPPPQPRGSRVGPPHRRRVPPRGHRPPHVVADAHRQHEDGEPEHERIDGAAGHRMGGAAARGRDDVQLGQHD